MSEAVRYVTDSDELTAVADAIRAKGGTSAPLSYPDGFVGAVQAINTGGDVSGKADKVSNATSGNFAALDNNGNLTDSGHKHSDYLASTLKGVANGLAELDSSGKVPTSQLPAELPSVTSSDNGKALMVDNGSWAAGNLPIASRLRNGTVSIGNNINVDSNGVISVDLSGKLDTANVYNDLDQTASGFALDARQGKSLNEAIANVQNGLAIVANGNTHAAIGAGQFVYVKNHNTLSDGLYTNKSGSTIAANDTLTSSNLQAESSGGFNSLNSKINTLLYSEKINCTPSSNLSAGAYGYFEVPVTYAKGKNIIATNINLGHPGLAGGYSLIGHYLSSMNVLYVGYYTPRAIGAANADFTVEIIYTSGPITSNAHSESV